MLTTAMALSAPALAGCASASRTTMPEIDQTDTEITTILFGDGEDQSEWRKKYINLASELNGNDISDEKLKKLQDEAVAIGLQIIKNEITKGANKQIDEEHVGGGANWTPENIKVLVYKEPNQNSKVKITFENSESTEWNNDGVENKDYIIENDNIAPEIRNLACHVAKLQSKDTLPREEILESLGKIAWWSIDYNVKMQKIDDGKNVKAGFER